MKTYQKFLTLLSVIILSGCMSRPAPMGAPDSPFGTYPSGPVIEGSGQNMPVETRPLAPGQIQAQTQEEGVIDPFSPMRGQPGVQEIKVGLLLPLSGTNAPLGQHLLQAAQLALFDMDAGHVKLLPKDTSGTATGAANAAQSAVDEGASLLIGPLFAQSVSGAGPVAKRNNTPMMAFSTDRTVAGSGVYIMGVLPSEQAEKMADYAFQRGMKTVGIVATGDSYGRITSRAFRERATARGIQVVATIDPADQSGFDQLMLARPQAIFLPMKGQGALNIATRIKQSHPMMPLLGTGLWDDPTIAMSPVMDGAVYAAPSPTLRRNFEKKYRNLYDQQPPRIASIAYDATALSVVLSRSQTTMPAGYTPAGMNRGPVLANAMRNPNGFSGIDGIFRFRPDGTAQRGLAVLSIRANRATISQSAPARF